MIENYLYLKNSTVFISIYIIVSNQSLTSDITLFTKCTRASFGMERNFLLN